MTDREQMELAALVAGAKMTDYSYRTPDHWVIQGSDGVWREWKPRDDDGDALRLAMKFPELLIAVENLRVTVFRRKEINIFEPTKDDTCAAARLAIFRAAVEIGRAMRESAALGGA